MKKAKALFAVAMILIVAGGSGGLWLLNEKGIIGGNKAEITTEAEVNAQDNNEDNEDDNNQPTAASSEESTTKNNEDISEEELALIDDFLTSFSKVYFCSSGEFDGSNEYDMVNFAFMHLKSNHTVGVENRDNEYYHYFSYSEVNRICNEFFGKDAPKKSVKTDNANEFYNYENDCFYTYAADGIGFVNYTKCDSAKIENGNINVEFTIYAPSEDGSEGNAINYGTATLSKDGSEYKLKTYDLGQN